MTKPAKVYANAATGVLHSQKRGDGCRQQEIKQRNQRVYDSLEKAVQIQYKPGRNYRACLKCFPQE